MLEQLEKLTILPPKEAAGMLVWIIVTGLDPPYYRKVSLACVESVTEYPWGTMIKVCRHLTDKEEKQEKRAESWPAEWQLEACASFPMWRAGYPRPLPLVAHRGIVTSSLAYSVSVSGWPS